MCIIIAKRAGVEPIKKEYFSKAWDSNSHGGGVVFKHKDGVVTVKKGFMNKEEFMTYLDGVNQKDTSFIAHFRIKSVGEVKPENCHPFVLKNVTFAHNGTLAIQALEGKTDSETFGLTCFKNHTLNWIKENQTLISMALGSSKFAIMDNKTGEILIVNEHLGQTRDDAWFSNNSAFPVVQTHHSYYSGCGYKPIGFWDDDYCTPKNTKNKMYKADKDFGTKTYTAYACRFDHNRKCWINDYSNSPKRPLWSGENIVTNKKGFLVLDKSVIPDANLKEHIYSPKEDVVRLMLDETEAIKQLLDDYHGSEFDSYLEKEEYERLIQQRYYVLNCVRRLVAAQKEVNEESLYDFAYAKFTKAAQTMSKYMEEQFTEFDNGLCEVVDEWINELAVNDELEMGSRMVA